MIVMIVVVIIISSGCRHRFCFVQTLGSALTGLTLFNPTRGSHMQSELALETQHKKGGSVLTFFIEC